MDVDRQVPALIMLPIDDERLETYREALFDRIDAPDVYEELTDTHITLHPGFKTTVHGIEAIRTYLDGRDSELDVTATAIYAYPSPDNPAVIAVAIRADIKRLREDVQNILDGYEHSIINEPSPTHLTLLKRRDIDAEAVPEAVYERVRKALDEMSLPTALQSGAPRVEWYNPPYKLDD